MIFDFCRAIYQYAAIKCFRKYLRSASGSALGVSQIQRTNIKYSDNKKHDGHNGSLRWLLIR